MLHILNFLLLYYFYHTISQTDIGTLHIWEFTCTVNKDSKHKFIFTMKDIAKNLFIGNVHIFY
jgi:hypothetical protein